MTTRKPASTVTRLRPSIKLFVLDTNVLMHDPTSLFRFEEHDIYIPMATLEELDHNKKGLSEVREEVPMVRFLERCLVGDAESKKKLIAKNLLGKSCTLG